MEVINVHRRIIPQSKEKVGELVNKLASSEDHLWPWENWPAMRFKDGLTVGAKGGHGPIRYTIKEIVPSDRITFKFYRPKGFNGIHGIEITEHSKKQTELKHFIRMNTSGSGTLKWLLVIRWLHDALEEDALDKAENYFTDQNKKTAWSPWVKLWRYLLK